MVCVFKDVNVIRNDNEWYFMIINKHESDSGILSFLVLSPDRLYIWLNSTKVYILSTVTDNCPTWISGRGRMAVEIISWSTKAMWPGFGSNSWICSQRRCRQRLRTQLLEWQKMLVLQFYTPKRWVTNSRYIAGQWLNMCGRAAL